MAEDRSVVVLLAAHRRPRTVSWSIRSVLEQSHAQLELHVVGDGCDDETARIARGTGDPRVRFHRFPKGYGFGYGHRNEVLKATRSRYVAYCTDDDLWFPDHLERSIRALEARRIDFVAHRSIHVSYPDQLDPWFFAFDWQNPFATRLLRNWFLGAVNCVHARSVLDAVGYWNARLARFGDREFCNRVRVSGVPSAYVDEPTLLRFYALHWDHRYAGLDAVPQARWWPRVRDAAWRDEVRRRAATGPRPAAARLRQWADFYRFALASGPKFLRFWYQKLASSRA